MNRAKTTSSPHRALVNAALFAALVGLAALLGQCRSVSNDVLGVGLQNGTEQASACTSQCTKTYRDAVKAENDLNKANVAACGNDQACLKAEQKRHEEALKALKKAYDDCIKNCHDQGAGSAGN